MQYIVLYQQSCTACSKVARMVSDLEIAGLEARPLADPRVAQLLGSAGKQSPDRPSLLVVDNDDVELISGWAMRRRLARVVGWRRSSSIIALLAAEWRARLAKSAGSPLPSRRSILGGATVAAISGGFAWRLASRDSPAARLGSGGTTPEVTQVGSAEAEKLLATTSMQRSIKAWGPAAEIYKVSGAQPSYIVSHPRNGIFTVVDNSRGAIQAGNPVAISLGNSPGTTPALRYYTIDAAPLVDVSVSNGIAKADPVHGQPSDENVPAGFYGFVMCVASNVSAPCALGCQSCAHNPTALCVAACITCAGPAGMKCARFLWG